MWNMKKLIPLKLRVEWWLLAAEKGKGKGDMGEG
jgi:hypothetical protein